MLINCIVKSVKSVKENNHGRRTCNIRNSETAERERV
jgi:hypothetical protein